MFIIFENYYDGCDQWASVLSITPNEENIKTIIVNYLKANDYKDKEIFIEYDGIHYYFSFFDENENVISSEDYKWFTVENVGNYKDRYLNH